MSPPLALILAIGSIAILAIACGSPGPRREFVFTPVPYTVVPIPEDCTLCSEYRSWNESYGEYFADQVKLTVEREHADALIEWAESYGFVVLHRTEGGGPPPRILLLLRVPLGSVVDAVRLIETQEGILAVDPIGLFRAR